MVGDRVSRKSQTITKQFTVLPEGFGLVRLSASADPEGAVPAGLLGTGQTIWINGLLVGFSRDSASKQPNVALEGRILDAAGKPTTTKPFSGTINKDISPSATSLPLQFMLALNRTGKFTIEVKATDLVANKSFTQSFPITVHPHD
jgi:hypothetical protein